MKFELSTSQKLARAVNDLRLGLPIHVEDYTIFAIETLNPLFYKQFPSSDAIVILSAERALDLHLSHDPSSPAALQLTRDYPFEKVRALADPVADFDYPMKGPLKQFELSRDYKLALLHLVKQAKLLPAVLLLKADEKVEGFTLNDLERFFSEATTTQAIARARVPLSFSKLNHLTLFRSGPIADENYVMEIGQPDKTKAPFVRLHSECFTGDCLGSMKCDCGPQLQSAMNYMAEHGGGYLLYLTQEGRGIGLANKIRAYALQDQGYDTVEANLKLGFLDDERDFATAAEILEKIGVNKLKLITNNPKKVAKLTERGFEIVERVPLKVGRNPENEDYLDIKASKSGHYL